MNEFERDVVVAELARFSGQIMPPVFFQKKRTNPAIGGAYQYHNLIRGVFKPNGVELALSIIQIQDSKYPDTLTEIPGKGWQLEYVKQASGITSWDNRALERCIGVAPIVVIRQTAKKTDKGGSKYKILGLGRVESYNRERGTFTISEWKGELVSPSVAATEQDVAFAEKSIHAALKKPFAIFSEEKKFNAVQRQARDAAFRKAVIDYYDGSCAVCGSKWNVRGNYEVEAAHIVSKEKNGSDDPRNGLALCRFHHWAFDRGLFTISDNFEIIVSSKISQFSAKPEQIAQFEGKKLKPPIEPKAKPDAQAIEWHRQNVFKSSLQDAL